jgi:hypothetical protein
LQLRAWTWKTWRSQAWGGLAKGAALVCRGHGVWSPNRQTRSIFVGLHFDSWTFYNYLALWGRFRSTQSRLQLPTHNSWNRFWNKRSCASRWFPLQLFLQNVWISKVRPSRATQSGFTRDLVW